MKKLIYITLIIFNLQGAQELINIDDCIDRVCFSWPHEENYHNNALISLGGDYGMYSKDKVFNKNRMSSVMFRNRKLLSSVDSWSDDYSYKNSLGLYGCSEDFRFMLDRDIGSDITYSDVIPYLNSFLKSEVSYLELGVSLGKNFIQVVDNILIGAAVGFEIESINPALKNFFKKEEILDSWNTFDKSNFSEAEVLNKAEQLLGVDSYKYEEDIIKYCTGERSIKKNSSTLASYDYEGSAVGVFYLNGDLFDDNTWLRLKNRKFNSVFSDAFHNSVGLVQEFMQIEKYGLLNDDEFVMVWDDLGEYEMTEVYFQIYKALREKHEGKLVSILLPVRGWAGVNECYHRIGIIIKSESFLRMVKESLSI